MEKYFLPMLTLCMSSGYLHASTPKNRMNIVLIMADDFGYECIGANGGNYQTPHIDKLAEEGIRFEHCHSNPLSGLEWQCSNRMPSSASLSICGV